MSIFANPMFGMMGQLQGQQMGGQPQMRQPAFPGGGPGQSQFMPMQRQVQQMFGQQQGGGGNSMGDMLRMMSQQQGGPGGFLGGMPGQQSGVPGQGESPQFATNAQGQRIPQNDAARAQMQGMGQQQQMVPGQQIDPAMMQGMMRSRAAQQGSRQPMSPFGAPPNSMIGQMPGMNMQNLMSGLSFMQGMPGGGGGFGQQFGRMNMPQQFQGQQRFFQ
jgi:hypothetical protein